MAACLAVGTRAAASHRTGARLAGLVEHSGPIELTVQGSQPRCLARLVGPGRGSYAELEHLIDARCPGDGDAGSPLESQALAILRAAELPEPVLQHPVRRPCGKVALIDLAYPDERVGIEVDGWAFHTQRVAFDEDRARGNDLALLGWQILHFTATTRPAHLVATVRRALDLAMTCGDVAS